MLPQADLGNLRLYQSLRWPWVKLRGRSKKYQLDPGCSRLHVGSPSQAPGSVKVTSSGSLVTVEKGPLNANHVDRMSQPASTSTPRQATLFAFGINAGPSPEQWDGQRASSGIGQHTQKGPGPAKLGVADGEAVEGDWQTSIRRCAADASLMDCGR